MKKGEQMEESLPQIFQQNIKELCRTKNQGRQLQITVVARVEVVEV